MPAGAGAGASAGAGAGGGAGAGAAAGGAGAGAAAGAGGDGAGGQEATAKPKVPFTKKLQMGHFDIKNSYASGTMPNTFTFPVPFLEPPVVIIAPNAVDPAPCNIRVRGVTTTGFSAWLVEPPGEDGPHKQQHVAYLAAAIGVHTLPDGRKFEVGKISTLQQVYSGSCKPDGVSDGWESIAFSNPFPEAPAFLTGLQSMMNENGNVPLEVSKPFLSVATKDLGSDGASIAIDRGEAAEHGTLVLHEVIGWMAFEPGYTIFKGALGANGRCAALLSEQVIRGQDDDPPVTVPFPIDLNSTSPLIVGSQSSRADSEGGWMRLRGATGMGVQVVIDEDNSCDAERSHEEEKVSLFACNVPFVL